MARRETDRTERPAKAAGGYVAELKRRGKESKVYSKHQLLGLALADVLADRRHKSLYIKLAKERGGERLLEIAKSVAERKDVRNRGAYFMALIAAEPKKNDSKQDPGRRE